MENFRTRLLQNQPQRYNIDLIVRTYEDVKTKAGTFKPYKIEQAWFTTTNSNGTEWELVSYSLK